MDMRDKDLDVWISSALQPGTTVSTQRKKRAWEQIRRHAARQRIFAPVEVEEEIGLIRQIFSFGRVFYGWAATMATEEVQYERARQSHYVMRYGGPSCGGRLVLQMVSPIGLHFMSPAI